MQRLTIGYYDDSPGPGGTTRYLCELLGALDRSRFDAVLFAPEACDWHEEVRAAGARVITQRPQSPGVEAPASSPKTVPADPKAAAGRRRSRLPAEIGLSRWLTGELARLRRLFRTQRVDLLHSNNAGAEPAPIAARLAGQPRVVATWHVDSTYDLLGERQTWWYRTLERCSMRALHGAIAVSRSTGEDWVRRCGLGTGYAARVQVIPNGIDPGRVERRHAKAEARAVLGLPADLPLVGSIGRLEQAKGYEYLIRALPQVTTVLGAPVLAIAGRGPLEGELRRLATQLGVAERVHFVGFLAEVRDLLEALDVYVQPSLCEAQGLAVLEAGGLELPVVASAVGGLAETVVSGVTGHLVPTRDPNALADAVSALIVDPARRVEMGAAGRQRVLAHYTRERMVAETMAFYERLLTPDRIETAAAGAPVSA
jgi:glycosyltransferase involved in cell wall biosynthesis